jgi:hypothetical protein
MQNYPAHLADINSILKSATVEGQPAMYGLEP